MSDKVTEEMSAEGATKIQADAHARATAIEAQVKEANARKALQAATAPAPPPTAPDPAKAAAEQAVKRAELRKAEAEADKAAVDARNAAAAAAIPKLPDAPTSGTITLGEGAGLAEGTMLGMKAVRSLSRAIAARLLKAAGAGPFVLVPMSAVPDIQRWQMFVRRCQIVEGRVGALAAAETGNHTKELAAATTITAVLALASTALNWLKPDYVLKGLTIDSSDTMLLAAVADELLAVHAEARMPALQGSLVPEPNTTLSEQLNAPFLLLDKASAGAARGGTLAPQWVALHAEIKAWCDSLLTADATGAVPFQALVREAQTVAAIGPTGVLVALALHKVVGSVFTKKGAFAGLGQPELLVSGSAVASFVAWRPHDGKVLASGLLSHHGNRERIAYAGRMFNND